ncbi:MAG: DUF4124 domain-containing protein [Desulfobacteraceae bacterium]
MKRSRMTLIGLVFLLLLAIAAPFFVPWPSGKPLMSFDRVKRILSDQYPVKRHVDQMSEKAKEKAGEIREKLQFQKKPEKVEAPSDQPPETLYKWRDQNGTWHFTNRPPPEGVDYTVVKWTGTEMPAPDQEK